MAGAVFRDSGSRISLSFVISGSCSRTRGAAFLVVETKIFSTGTTCETREKVSWIMVSSDVKAWNCLGFSLRERGQRRVPVPPAMMTI